MADDFAEDLAIKVDYRGEAEARNINTDQYEEPEAWKEYYPFLDSVNAVGETLSPIEESPAMRYCMEIQQQLDNKVDQKFSEKSRGNRTKAIAYYNDVLPQLITKSVPSSVRQMKPFGAASNVNEWAIETATWTTDHFFFQRVHEFIMPPAIAQAVTEVLLKISGNVNRMRRSPKVLSRINEYELHLRNYFQTPDLKLQLYETILDRVRCYAEVVYCGEQDQHGKEYMEKNRGNQDNDDLTSFYQMTEATSSLESFLKEFGNYGSKLQAELCEVDDWLQKIQDLATVLNAQTCSGFIEIDDAEYSGGLIAEMRNEMKEYQLLLIHYKYQYDRLLKAAATLDTSSEEEVNAFVEKIQAAWPRGPKKIAEEWGKATITDKQKKLREEMRKKAQQVVREFCHQFFPRRELEACNRDGQPTCEEKDRVDANTFVEENIRLIYMMIDVYILANKQHYLLPKLLGFASLKALGGYWALNINPPPHVLQEIRDHEGRLVKMGVYEDNENLFPTAVKHFDILLIKMKDEDWSKHALAKRNNMRGAGGEDGDAERKLLQCYCAREELRRRKQKLDDDLKNNRIDESQYDSRVNQMAHTENFLAVTINQWGDTLGKLNKQIEVMRKEIDEQAKQARRNSRGSKHGQH